jgi:phage-related protein
MQFPEDARTKAGRELPSVQRGLTPTDWKPFSRIGRAGCEIGIECGDGAFRVIYVAKFEEAVYVLHCFEKRSRKTAKSDIDIATARYRDLIKERNLVLLCYNRRFSSG